MASSDATGYSTACCRPGVTAEKRADSPVRRGKTAKNACSGPSQADSRPCKCLIRFASEQIPLRCQTAEFGGPIRGIIWPNSGTASELASFRCDESEPRLEQLQDLGEAGGDPQSLPSSLNKKLGRAGRSWSRFDDAVGGRFLRVPKHREQRHSIPVVDRIVAPDAP